MPRPPIDTPTRRVLMQGVMWLILGGTVGLAALVSYQRHNALKTKFANPLNHRGVTVQLPSGWMISKIPDPLSSTVLTATEPQRGDQAGRVIRILHEPLSAHSAPLEYAHFRLTPEDAVPTKEGDITIADSPGVILSIPRARTPKTLQEMLNGGVEGKALCAASIPPSGRPIAIELEGPGQVDSNDIDLLQHIAASIKLDNEPALSTDREIPIGDSIRLTIPDDFALIPQKDPFLTVRQLRPRKNDSDWRSIDLLPIVLLPKDTAATVITQLSLYESSDFQGAIPQQDNTGVWQIDANSALRDFLPLHACAIAKNGVGLLAIFRGGKDASWIDPAWQAIRDKLAFSDDSNTDTLLANGKEETDRLGKAGLASLLPDSIDELWWLNYMNSPAQPIGWVHLIPGATNGKFEERSLIEKQLEETLYEWRGSTDLKIYRARSDFAVSDLRNPQSKLKQNWTLQANLRNDRIDLTPDGTQRPLSYPTPPNYIPGGWLPMLLNKLSNRPMILRTDSFVDYSYVQPTDLLTVIIRPQPDAPRTGDDSGTPLHCVLVEFSGSGENSRWYFQPDGTLDSVDYSQFLHLVRRDEHDIQMDFSTNTPLHP